MRRELTEEQKAKSAERKAKFRALWQQVAKMPELERIQLANQLGLTTCEGHPLSPVNSWLVHLQCPNASVLGGFRQWLKQGRAVRKGEHGAMIWVPTGGRKNDRPLDGSTSASAVVDGQPAGDEDTRFIVGTVFDIAQTDPISDEPIAVCSPEVANAFGLASLPNVRVEAVNA